MKYYFKIAWRNIWRNKRRSIITISSIFFALFFALLMRAMQLGSYDNMIENVISTFSGQIQIQSTDYINEKNINNTFEFNDEIEKILSNSSNIKTFNPRLESFALASYELNTKGVLVLGIDHIKENELSNIKEKIIDGEYFNDENSGLIITKTLANYLNVKLNDTLVLISQGFQGMSAAGKYNILGIVKMPSPQLDKQLVFLKLKDAQELYSCPHRITSVSINVKNAKKIAEENLNLQKDLKNLNLKSMDWKQLSPELVQQIESDNASGIIMLGILYLIVGFGVLGTVLMMINERKKEFGISISIGMKRLKLIIITILELLYMGLIGIIFGTFVSFPLIYYFHKNPIPLQGEMAKSMENFGLEAIIPVSTDFTIFINQSIVVLIIVLISGIFPLMTIYRLNIVKSVKM